MTKRVGGGTKRCVTSLWVGLRGGGTGGEKWATKFGQRAKKMAFHQGIGDGPDEAERGRGGRPALVVTEEGQIGARLRKE